MIYSYGKSATASRLRSAADAVVATRRLKAAGKVGVDGVGSAPASAMAAKAFNDKGDDVKAAGKKQSKKVIF